MLDDNIPDTDSNMPIAQPDQVPPPPAGDSEKAEKYLGQLIGLIDTDKLEVIHTDLQKFNIDSVQDHYRMDLGEYEVEVNHSKQPDSGQDIYVLLFNNLKKIEEGGESCVNKVILAYTHLSKNQFDNFKSAAQRALDRKKQREDQVRFTEVMAPVDNALNNLASSSPIAEPEADLADFATEHNESNQYPAN